MLLRELPMEDNYDSVLRRLKEERMRRNMTQRLLCYYMQIQQSHFSRAETGQRRFSYHELKGLCRSDVDMHYIFTGKRTKSGREFLCLSEPSLEELICFLNTIHALSSIARFADQSGTSFGEIHRQLEYLQCGSGNAKGQANVFLCVRNHCGYTQNRMSDSLGVDIKKLRELEKGRLLPDSELIWKMYSLFRISPSLILKDVKSMWNELNYILELMDDTDRDIVLRILEDEHRLIHRA